MDGSNDSGVNIDAVMDELRAQRNQALDMLANANGVIVSLRKQVAALKERAAADETPNASA